MEFGLTTFAEIIDDRTTPGERLRQVVAEGPSWRAWTNSMKCISSPSPSSNRQRNRTASAARRRGAACSRARTRAAWPGGARPLII